MIDAFAADRPLAQRIASAAVAALAIGLGLAYGYEFGHRVGGVLLGVVMALNAAACFSIVSSALMDRTVRWLRPTAAHEPRA
jgi:type IV secretory pathway VirB2 component (pilin)